MQLIFMNVGAEVLPCHTHVKEESFTIRKKIITLSFQKDTIHILQKFMTKFNFQTRRLDIKNHSDEITYSLHLGMDSGSLLKAII